MTNRLQLGCEMLRYAITNKKSLLQTCLSYSKNRKYLSDIRLDCKGRDGFEEFESLYKQALGIEKNRPLNNSESQLGEVKREKVTFTKEGKEGTLDAVGKSHVRTLQSLLEQAKVDQLLWSVERHIINKWDVHTKHGKVYQNWQVKAWLKRNTAIEESIDINDFYSKKITKHKPIKYKPVAYKKSREKNLLEISIFDAHVGKLCWSGETGEDYDIKIATRRFKQAIEKAIQRASGNDFNRILFIVGNDFFNSDTKDNTTTSGTVQDEDTRWRKTFKLGFTLLVDAIDYMRQFAPVDVLVIPGNHDEQRSFFVGFALESWYREDKCVSVDNSPPLRKYYRYGTNLLGFTHGDKEKEDRLPQLMAHEVKKDWSETTFHEWHLGHLHKKMAVKFKVPIYDEDLGVVVRRLSSISGTDNWHFGKSFVGTQKAAEAFLWNEKDGLIGHFNITIDMN